MQPDSTAVGAAAGYYTSRSLFSFALPPCMPRHRLLVLFPFLLLLLLLALQLCTPLSHLCCSLSAVFSPDAYVLVPYVLTSGVQAMVPKREKSDLTLKIGAFEGDLDDDQVAVSSARSLHGIFSGAASREYRTSLGCIWCRRVALLLVSFTCTALLCQRIASP